MRGWGVIVADVLGGVVDVVIGRLWVDLRTWRLLRMVSWPVPGLTDSLMVVRSVSASTVWGDSVGAVSGHGEECLFVLLNYFWFCF